jgi:hypothetical protein
MVSQADRLLFDTHCKRVANNLFGLSIVSFGLKMLKSEHPQLYLPAVTISLNQFTSPLITKTGNQNSLIWYCGK